MELTSFVLFISKSIVLSLNCECSYISKFCFYLSSYTSCWDGESSDLSSSIDVSTYAWGFWLLNVIRSIVLLSYEKHNA